MCLDDYSILYFENKLQNNGLCLKLSVLFCSNLTASKKSFTYEQMILARNFKLQGIITSCYSIWNSYQVFIQKLLKNYMCWDTYETPDVPSYSDAVFMNILVIACCPKG